MNWIEKYVLRYRTVNIDKEIVRNAIKKIATEFSNYLYKYDIKKDIQTDYETYFGIKDDFMINILTNEHGIQFNIKLTEMGFENNGSFIYKIEPDKNNGWYVISAFNKYSNEMSDEICYSITEETIQEIFYKLLDGNGRIIKEE